MAVVFAELKNTAGHAHPGHQSPAVHHGDTFRAALWHRGVTANSAAFHGELKNDGGGEAIGPRGISSHSCGCARGLFENRRAAADRELEAEAGRIQGRRCGRKQRARSARFGAETLGFDLAAHSNDFGSSLSSASVRRCGQFCAGSSRSRWRGRVPSQALLLMAVADGMEKNRARG